MLDIFYKNYFAKINAQKNKNGYYDVWHISPDMHDSLSRGKMQDTLEGFIEVERVRIHYITKGPIDPAKRSLLFVPGVMMPGWIWNKQLDYFARHYNVIAIDPRSHGDSDQTSEGHYAAAMAKDIAALVEELSLEHLILIGWSIAVPQVIQYTIHNGGNRLEKLVLVDGVTGIDPSWSFYHSMVDYWMAFQTDRSLKTDEFLRIIFQQRQDEGYLQRLKEVAMRMPTATVVTLIMNYMFQDFRGLLAEIKVPTLIVTVEGPRLEYMNMMHERIPQCHFELISEAGHAVFVDQPDRFNSALETFLFSGQLC